MVKNIVGIQHIDFLDRESGERVTGIKLHWVGEMSNVDEGLAADSLWIPSNSRFYENVCALKLDDTVDVERNSRGKYDAGTIRVITKE